MNGVIGEARRHRLLQVHRQEGPGVRRARVRPGATVRRSTRCSTCYRVGGAHVGGNDDIGGYVGARQLPAVHRSRGRHLCRARAAITWSQGGPTTSIASKSTPVEADADAGPVRAQPVCRHRCAGAAGQSHGLPGQRRAGRLRRRVESGVQGPAAGRHRRNAADGAPIAATCRCCSPPRPMRRSAARWSTSIGRPADPNVKVEGHLDQRTSLIRGQNNVEVWNQYSRADGHGGDRRSRRSRSKSSSRRCRWCATVR